MIFGINVLELSSEAFVGDCWGVWDVLFRRLWNGKYDRIGQYWYAYLWGRIMRSMYGD